jgi:hypothetical protein
MRRDDQKEGFMSEAKKRAGTGKSGTTTRAKSKGGANKKSATDSAGLESSTGLNKVEDRLLLGLPPLTQAQRSAFRSQFSDAQCDALGTRTKAEAVGRDARAWAATIDASLRKHPDVLRRYGKARFAWFLECIRDLYQALDAQRAARGSVGASKRQAGYAREAARAAREDLLEALEMIVGGSEAERESLSAASGAARSNEEIARSLRSLADLAEGWLKERAAGDATLEGKGTARDAPAVNRIEGRLLLEMRIVMRVFARAHERNAVVPRLTPGPGTRPVLRSRSAAGGKEEPEPTAQGETGGEG